MCKYQREQRQKGVAQRYKNKIETKKGLEFALIHKMPNFEFFEQ
jgi:hypothetical protein